MSGFPLTFLMHCVYLNGPIEVHYPAVTGAWVLLYVVDLS